jgi:hypothetical protein
MALYELKGDTLTLCIQRSGKDRPTALKGGGTCILCVLKRQKKAR